MKNFQCNICLMDFSSQWDRDEHLEQHFERISCEQCKKELILIGNKVYELHGTWNCDQGYESSGDQSPNSHGAIDLGGVRENVDKIEILSEYFETDDRIPVEINNIEDGDADLRNFKRTSCKAGKSASVISSKEDLIDKIVIKGNQTGACEMSVDDDLNLLNKSTKDRHTKNHQSDTKHLNNPTHPPAIKFDCDHCDKTLKSARSLSFHLRKAHHLEKSKTCEICNMQFKTVSNLTKHRQNIHTDNMRFICSYCGRGFNYKYNLKEHINGHTGDRPHVCNICGKTFGRSTLLLVHSRVHTGHKPYKCDASGCGRTFAHGVDMKRHRYREHGIFTKKYECSICSKVFPENKYLRKHMRSHLNDRK